MGSDPAVRSTVREACPQAPARPVAIKGDGAMRGMDGERADPAETLHRRILAPQSRIADPPLSCLGRMQRASRPFRGDASRLTGRACF